MISRSSSVSFPGLLRISSGTLTFPNVLVTSHQAYLTTDALDAIAGTTVENIRGYYEGERGEGINEVAPETL